MQICYLEPARFGRPVDAPSGDDDAAVDLDPSQIEQPDIGPEIDDMPWHVLNARQHTDELNPLLANFDQMLAAAEVMASRGHWARPVRISIVAPPGEIVPQDIVDVAAKAGWAVDQDNVGTATSDHTPRLLLLTAATQRLPSPPASLSYYTAHVLLASDEAALAEADTSLLLNLNWLSPACRRLLIAQMWTRRCRLVDPSFTPAPLTDALIDCLAEIPPQYLPTTLDLLLGNCVHRQSDAPDPAILGPVWGAFDPRHMSLPTPEYGLVAALGCALHARAAAHNVQILTASYIGFNCAMAVGGWLCSVDVHLRQPERPGDPDTLFVRAGLRFSMKKEMAAAAVTAANAFHVLPTLGAIAVVEDDGGWLKVSWTLPFTPQVGARAAALDRFADQFWSTLGEVIKVFADLMLGLAS